MVNPYDDKSSPIVDRRVSTVNECFEDDDDDVFEDEGVCYNSVEQDQVENGVVEAPNFGNIAVVDSTNVHFGNKTYYQGPVTVLKQTIVSPSEVKKTNSCETSGLPSASKEGTNKNAVNKVRLALCPRSKRRQLIAAGVATATVLLVTSIYLSVLIGQIRTTSGKDNTVSKPLVDTGDGTISNVYANPSNDSGHFLDAPVLRIRGRSEWLAQPPVDKIRDLKTPVPNVIISHSASEGCFTTAECIERIRTIQLFHIEAKKWSDIGYNFLVGGEGAVYEGRGWDKEGAHSLGWNLKSVGICVVGTFTTMEPTAKQLDSTQKLIAFGVALGKIDKNYRLLAHSQVQSTESPGRLMFAIMQNWPHWYNTTSLIN